MADLSQMSDDELREIIAGGGGDLPGWRAQSDGDDWVPVPQGFVLDTPSRTIGNPSFIPLPDAKGENPSFIPLPDELPPQKRGAPDAIDLSPYEKKKTAPPATIKLDGRVPVGPHPQARPQADKALDNSPYATATVRGLLDNTFGAPRGMIDAANYIARRLFGAATGVPAAELEKRNADIEQQKREFEKQHFGFELPRPPSVDEIVARYVEPYFGAYKPTPDQPLETTIGTGAVEGAVSMLGPAGFLKGLKALTEGERAVQIARTILNSTAKAAPVGAAAGATGNVVGTYGDPLAGMAASMLVGGVMSAAGHYAGKTANAYTAPMRPSQRQGLADQKLLAKTADPEKARADLEFQPSELVPGSRPTTGELTGDPGLLAATKQQRTASPDFAAELAEREGQQNAARRSALNSTAPTDADPMAATKLFRDRLAAIDAESSAAVDQARKAAEEAHAGLPPGVPAEVSGTALREALSEHMATARAKRSALYRSVEPSNELSVALIGSRDAAKGLASNLDPAFTLESPHAAPVIKMMATLPETAPFGKVMDLDATLSAQMQAAIRAHDYVGHGQLVQLKKALSGDLDNGLEKLHAAQQQAVQRGELAPENTVAEQLRRFSEDADRFAAQDAGRGIVARDATTGAPSTAGVPGGEGSPSPTGRRLSVSQGDQGVPGGVPQFDPEAPARLKAAKQAHAEFDQTYRKGPVGRVLDTTGFSGQYKIGAPAVPARAFPKGPGGYTDTSAFLKAANNDPAAVTALQDIATAQLRERMRGAAQLTPQTLEAWKRDHGPALRALGEVSPGFSSRFDSVAKATDSLGAAEKARAAALADAQQGAAARIAGFTDPQEVGRHVGQLIGTKDGPTQLAELVNRAKANPDALAGLRRAGIDHLMATLQNVGMSGGERALSGRLMPYVDRNAASLRALYGNDGLANVRRVVADMERSQSALDAVKVKGGSDTGANLWERIANSHAAHDAGTFGLWYSVWQAYEHGGLEGAALAGAAALTLKPALRFVQNMRAAGVENVNDLYRMGLLDPEVGKAMLQRAVDAKGRPNIEALSQLLRAVTRAAAPLRGYGQGDQREGRASGGRIARDAAADARKLLALAERVKTLHQDKSKSLLRMPDEAVAHALRIANRAVGGHV